MSVSQFLLLVYLLLRTVPLIVVSLHGHVHVSKDHVLGSPGGPLVLSVACGE